MAISAEYGVNPFWFGHADYGQNLARGYNPMQILQYVNQNMNRVRDWNRPGKGGLYDQLVRDARDYEQKQEQIAASQQQYQAVQRQMEQQQALAKQQAADAARQMQISQAAGQRDQADVRPSRGKAERKKLTTAGTTGYFGRKGLRIGGVNVASQGAAGSGSFA